MISSFFGKTKPITYLVLFGLLLLFFSFNYFLGLKAYSFFSILKTYVVSLALMAIQIAILNRIVFTTRVTERTSFAMLFFVLFVLSFLETTENMPVMASNIFLVWAIYEMLKIDGTKRLNISVFNASLFICFASLFHPQALYFLLAVFIGIYMFCGNQLRNWLMPLVAFFCFIMVSQAFMMLFAPPYYFWDRYGNILHLEFIDIMAFTSYTRLIVYTLSVVMVSFLGFLHSRISGVVKALELRFLFYVFLISIFISLLANEEGNGLGVLLYSFCPASILITNYFEIFKRKRLKEVVLLVCILLPITFATWMFLS